MNNLTVTIWKISIPLLITGESYATFSTYPKSEEESRCGMQNQLQNIVGPQIRGFRYALAWSRSKLAVKLQLLGFDMSRESLAKVESQIHKVEDFQLPYYARALSVQVADLFPPLPSGKPINDVIMALRV